ncbi:MAG: RDD family protein [Methanocella sp.]
MSLRKAEFGPRFLAAFVDGAVCAVLSLLPFIGFLIGAAYLLVKDGIMYELTKKEEWRNRSVGKKLLSLEVVALDGNRVDLVTSAKRNLPLSVGSIIAVVPAIGLIIGPFAGLVLGIVEIYLVLTDPEGRRLGDRWAGTQVVATEAASVGRTLQ